MLKILSAKHLSRVPETIIFGILLRNTPKMTLFLRRILFLALGVTLTLPVFCQSVKPGVPGMAPSKWITIKNSQAPGRTYRFDNNTLKTYTQEDIYFKMWLPVVHKPNFGIMVGPQFRTEQLEFKDQGENPIHQLSNWNLRSMGVDVKSYATLDSTSVLLMGLQANQSSSISHSPKNIPLNFTATVAFLRKRSLTKEIGFGLLVGRGFNRFTVLPVFVYNNSYSRKTGIEIGLPYKLAWRHNLSPSDILYVKAEGTTRSYYCNGINDGSGAFRRTDLDLGLSYNRKITNLFGVEFFGGYKMNIANNLPANVTPVKTSGMAFSFEVYVKAPGGKSK